MIGARIVDNSIDDNPNFCSSCGSSLLLLLLLLLSVIGGFGTGTTARFFIAFAGFAVTPPHLLTRHDITAFSAGSYSLFLNAFLSIKYFHRNSLKHSIAIESHNSHPIRSPLTIASRLNRSMFWNEFFERLFSLRFCFTCSACAFLFASLAAIFSSVSTLFVVVVVVLIVFNANNSSFALLCASKILIASCFAFKLFSGSPCPSFALPGGSGCSTTVAPNCNSCVVRIFVLIT